MNTYTFDIATNPRTFGVDNGFASVSLRAELLALKETAAAFPVVNFAFTDYGGSFFDKVAIEYFIAKHPGSIVFESTSWYGRNAFVFGEVAARFLEETEDYPLGFDEFEEYFCQRESEETDAGFNRFLDDLSGYEFDRETVFSWLSEHKSGYYNITTQGLDFCESDLIEELNQNGLIARESE